eukprot:CAMPEP_0119551450 /NCGR_PEP_ID=MMETSP1352-20130426/4709_1 /TAXON_ID=265584 /ORGANISM="Stauroneis constricta, Strain CCMP1120" /LENGTH=240 /DNA_ID=CAMNT_0007597517 /DNA_START=70 /DNA_END=792 /DNA_ORIENTATION=-
MTMKPVAAIGSLAIVASVHAACYYYYYHLNKSKSEEKTKSNDTDEDNNAKIGITLPTWAIEYEKSLKDINFTTDEERMKVAIELSARNVQNNTGGPFGCAIFESKGTECKLFSIGINRVVPLNNSTLHGEMVAIQFAQQKLQSFSMMCCKSADTKYLMYSSCEPCAMCLGGTLWSGVSELVCAATKADAEAIGFNEGPVFEASYQQLMASGVVVKRNVLRKEGAAVLEAYGRSGVIYNSS